MHNDFSRLTSVATLFALAACGDITSLKQSNPGQLSAGTIYVPANAQLLVNGLIADFDCAYSRYVTGSALFTDELLNSFANTGTYDYERRTIVTNSGYGTTGCGNQSSPSIYTTLSTARGVADTALAKLEGWTDEQVLNRTRLVGQAAAYAGYSLVLLGEAMCSAAINVGPEMTPAELYAEANTRFDKAVAAATTANDTPTLMLAILGKARSLLNLGDAPNAAIEAAKVTPATFVYNFTANGTDLRRQNFVFFHNSQNSWSTVDSSFRNLTLNGAPDPRVAVTNTGRNGTAAALAIWTPNKYATLTAAMPIAKYAEAQLIIAEAKALAGDLAGAATAINAARNTRTGMAQYDATGQTAAQVRTQIIEERRREFFLEGHRLGDIRRYNLPLTPAVGAPYAPGGGTYGDQRCFPLPDVERINNPNIG
jgi:starch-binding outer membrane protein, SusD/RagB family